MYSSRSETSKWSKHKCGTIRIHTDNTQWHSFAQVQILRIANGTLHRVGFIIFKITSNLNRLCIFKGDFQVSE
jgi:hypothetical protein